MNRCNTATVKLKIKIIQDVNIKIPAGKERSNCPKPQQKISTKTVIFIATK